MKTKMIAVIGVLVVLAAAAYYFVANDTEKSVPVSSTFEMNLWALDDEGVAAWVVGNKPEANISEVREGDRVFFPIVFRNYAVDAKGIGNVSGVVTMKKPDGSEAWRFEYPSLTEGLVATTTTEFVMMTPAANGDDFTPSEEYPLGTYTIHAEVMDVTSGTTASSDIVIEKIAQ